jgi:chromosome segregation ATPase
MNGEGLWCTSTEQVLPLVVPEKKPPPSLTTDEVTGKVNSDLVAVLEKKCSNLVMNWEKLRVERDLLQLELERAKKQFEGSLGDMKVKVSRAQQAREDMKKELDELCLSEILAQSQIKSLMEELTIEQTRRDNYKLLYDQEADGRQEEAAKHAQEIEVLRLEMQRQTQGLFEIIDELEKQNGALLKWLQKRRVTKRAEKEETQVEGPENALEEQKHKILTLNMDNRVLVLKIKELEEARSKNHEFLKLKDDSIKDLKGRIVQLTEAVRQEQVLRKHQADLVEQKNSHLRKLQERLKALESENKQLRAVKISPVQKKQSPKIKEVQEVYVAVEARPDLFK